MLEEKSTALLVENLRKRLQLPSDIDATDEGILKGTEGTFMRHTAELEVAKDIIPPKGYQVVSEKAIAWLFDNHREVYDGFYERL